MRPKTALSSLHCCRRLRKLAPGAYYELVRRHASRRTFFAAMRDTTETPVGDAHALAYPEEFPDITSQLSISRRKFRAAICHRHASCRLQRTLKSVRRCIRAARDAQNWASKKNPLDNLGVLRDEMMRAVRLVVDTGIHYRGRGKGRRRFITMMENAGRGGRRYRGGRALFCVIRVRLATRLGC